MTQLTPDEASEIRALRRAGMSVTGIVIAMNRYRGLALTGRQVDYYLTKAGVRRPRVSRGRVVAE